LFQDMFLVYFALLFACF